MHELKLTLIGGPTVLIEMGGLRLLTDPTFDPAGSEYHLGPVTLKKTVSPALNINSLGHIDAILLSHEQHSDNLDQSGRALLTKARQVFTTPQSATNLNTHATGLLAWQDVYLTAPGGQRLKITGTPARHGPVGAEKYSGEVTGFVLTWENESPPHSFYISGDTVWYDELSQIPKTFDVRIAILNLGAARLDLIGPVDLTMNAMGAIEAAKVFPSATFVPVHVDGWTHFSESQSAVAGAFREANLTNRLRWLAPGVPVDLGY